jgi:hypothetical protein
MNDYLLLYTNVAVTIGQELPVIVTLPVASAITYGQSLSNAVLSGGAASAPGIFAFTFPGFTPSAGTSNQSVTFAPADTTNFASVSTNVLVTVYRAPPKIISAPVVSPITFGQALSNSVLNAGIASVPGIFAFTTPSASPVAGSNIESVIFLPTDAVDFTTAIFGSVAQFVGF